MDRDQREPPPPQGRAADPDLAQRTDGKPPPVMLRDTTAAPATDTKTVAEAAAAGYARPMRVMHWTVVALVLVQLMVGMWIAGVPQDAENEALLGRLFGLHATTGLTIFALMIWRLRMRRRYGVPPSPPGTPEEAKSLALLNHRLFYVLLLAMPVVGWFALNSSDPDTAGFLGRLHGATALVLVAAIGAHLAGVAYHTYVRRDGLLRRMTL
jgi:cytochrome b561